MSIFLKIVLWGIIVCVGVFGGIQLISLICAYCGNKDGVRLHFDEFKRIYELAPSQWCEHGYQFERKQLVNRQDKKYGWECIETTISMKTFWDFIFLCIWMKKKEIEKARKEKQKKEEKALKGLKYFVDSDAERIRKELMEYYKKAEEIQKEVSENLEK